MLEKKNLIKSGIAVATLVVASMFGFSAAFGYGGSVSVPTCSSLVYGEWKPCVSGIQYRDVLSQTPFGCTVSVSQQLLRSRTCEVTPVTPVTPEVLGEKKYAEGSLVRLPGSAKIYVVKNGVLVHIKTIEELAKYNGKKITVLNTPSTGSVAGVKTYSNGQLIRAIGDVKVYFLLNGKKHHVLNLAELKKNHFGKEIFNVASGSVDQYPNE